jgi:hypothetical protein
VSLIAPNLLVPVPPPDDPSAHVLQLGCTCACQRRSGGWRHTERCDVVVDWIALADVIDRGAARLSGGARG